MQHKGRDADRFGRPVGSGSDAPLNTRPLPPLPPLGQGIAATDNGAAQRPRPARGGPAARGEPAPSSSQAALRMAGAAGRGGLQGLGKKPPRQSARCSALSRAGQGGLKTLLGVTTGPSALLSHFQ